nr:hypothetical protein [Tanacetum cinerariifolium]
MFGSSIEPANVAEALRDADWVNAMQEELDQFTRLKVWRLVPRPEGKSVIKSKWIFKNKKDESDLLFETKQGWFASKQYPDHVYALDKALYGLKQAPRAWSTNPKYCTKFLDLMVKRFEMSMMGEMKFVLGLQVNQFSNEIFINQSKYILDILKRFVMENCDAVPTPMVEQAKHKLDLVGKPVDHTDYLSMIGSLMYVTSSRPDIMFATYLAGCDLDPKTESEYVAVSSCCTQVLWMRTQLKDYGFFYDKLPIYYDSKNAIAISYNLVQHTRTKHIDVRYHFIKDHVEKGTIEFYFVGTEYQLADLFTKSLSEARFKFLVEKLGMMSRET